MNNINHQFKSIIAFYVLQFLFLADGGAQATIGDIPLPSHEYNRLNANKDSYAHWLRNLPLEEPGSSVYDFKGNIFKSGTDSSVAAVVKWNISGRRLEQCMDIVIRLYAEFLWQEHKTDNLKLPLPGGTWLYWNHWRSGYRPFFKGIQVDLRKSTHPDSTYSNYIKFLHTIFSESHTQQFYHSYHPVMRENVQIGDFIVRKGTKGHAVMIVDLAQNARGELVALIGNGDTPACQFFLLNHTKGNPWVPLNRDEEAIPLPLRRKMTWDGLRRFELPKRK